MAINPSINRSLETVSTPNTAASAVNNTDQVDEASLLDFGEKIDNLTSDIAYNPGIDGDNSFKETYMALAKADMEVSETEMIVFDGMYSSYQTQLHGTRAQITEMESEISQKETQVQEEEAKTDIKTEINDKGNALFTTSGGYQVETDVNKGGNQTWIRNSKGETLAHIHGDPHVDLNADGKNDFHFGDNSSFILDDGTEIFLNTENVAGTDEAGGYTHSKVFFTSGVYVKAGENIIQTGDDTKDDGNRESAFRTDVDPAEMKIGKDEDGAALFGLDNQGNAYISNGEAGWNHLEDESWGGYLEDASFEDQHGAVSSFKPQEFMAKTDIATIRDEREALMVTVLSLQNDEESLAANVVEYDVLRKDAESNYDSAASEYERYSAMEDSDFKDSDETRFNAEQKSLELVDRSATLGHHLHNNYSLVNDADKASLSKNRYGYFNMQMQTTREMMEDEIEYDLSQYDNEGLIDTNDNIARVDDMLASIRLLVESSGFEDASLEFDNIIAEDNKQFSQGISDLSDLLANSGDALVVKDDKVLGAASPEIDKILTNLERLVKTDEVSATYQNITDLLSTDFIGQEADRVNGFVDQVGIDFQDISKEEALNLYERHTVYDEDLAEQRSEFEVLDTDLAKVNLSDLNVYDNANNKIKVELEKQYGFSPDQIFD